MKARHLILMLLNELGGNIDSKTKIQKEIYFISLLLKKDFGFQAHYYGPYSLEVDKGLDELVGAGFLNVKRDIFGYNMKQGREVKRYDFFLSESGLKFADILANDYPKEKKVVQTFTSRLSEIGNPNYLSLSKAAKAYFILKKEGKPLTKDQIRVKAEELDWSIENPDINSAIDILSKLEFVQEG